MNQLREAFHCEWTKLRTVPSTAWLLLTAVVLTVGASTLATLVVSAPHDAGHFSTTVARVLAPTVSTTAVSSSHPVLGTVRSLVHSACRASRRLAHFARSVPVMRPSGVAGRWRRPGR